MRNLSWMVALAGILTTPASVWAATTYYVAPGGTDKGPGSMATPWATLQHAADTVAAGDIVIVKAGNYAGFDCQTTGTAQMPITFSAEAGAIINQPNPHTPDGINVENASHVVVEGFTVNGVPRAGLRAAVGDHITFRKNKADKNGKWGVLTGHVDDLLIEQNETSNSVEQHGIYVGNSGDRPIIRHNRVWGNSANGIHMNGDVSQGGDGIISGAIVEGNIIYSNGATGGSGINCDGVQGSVIRNNLIYDEHASGISLYMIDGAAPANNNVVVNNTIIIASNGRWALNIQDGSSGTQAYNNIFINLNPTRGAIDLCSPGCEVGFVSDYNVVTDRFTLDGGSVLSLAAWQKQTTQDAHSFVSDGAKLFVNEAMSDYHLSMTSPAIDKGTMTNAPPDDLDGNARPAGAAVDIGAYEYCGANCNPSMSSSSSSGGGAGAASSSTGASSGASGASGGGGAGGSQTNGGNGGATGSCGCVVGGDPGERPHLFAAAVGAIVLLRARRRKTLSKASDGRRIGSVMTPKK